MWFANRKRVKKGWRMSNSPWKWGTRFEIWDGYVVFYGFSLRKTTGFYMDMRICGHNFGDSSRHSRLFWPPRQSKRRHKNVAKVAWTHLNRHVQSIPHVCKGAKDAMKSLLRHNLETWTMASSGWKEKKLKEIINYAKIIKKSPRKNSYKSGTFCQVTNAEQLFEAEERKEAAASKFRGCDRVGFCTDPSDSQPIPIHLLQRPHSLRFLVEKHEYSAGKKTRRCK